MIRDCFYSNHTASNSTQLKGMGSFLALNALNFAEADRPFNRLSEHQLAEMYFTLALQCHCTIPYVSSLPMVSLPLYWEYRCAMHCCIISYFTML